MKYFAPLSSPKQKHLKMKNDIDFYKLSNGKLGAINFNNMIPVPDGSYTLIGTKTQSLTYQEQKYKALLRNQLRWLNPDGEKLRDIASNLYMNRINNTLPFRVQKRCCDFQLLEEKCKEYTKMISTKSFISIPPKWNTSHAKSTSSMAGAAYQLFIEKLIHP